MKTSLRAKSDLLVAPLLVCTILVVYAIFLPTTYFRDVLSYGLVVERGDLLELFDPQHLLWTAVGRGFYSLWQMFGYGGRALLPLQVLGSLFGAVGAVALYLEVKRLTRDWQTGLFAATLMTFSYAYWMYSIQGYPYVPSIVLLLLAAIFLTHSRESGQGEVLLLGLAVACSAGAIFFHQLTVLFVAAEAVLVLTGEGPFLTRLKSSLLYLVLVALLVLTAYLLVGVTVRHVQTLDQFWTFITERLHDPALAVGAGHGSLSILQLAKAPIGLGNLFVGEVFAMEFLLGNPSMAERITLLSPSGAPQFYRAMPPMATTWMLFCLAVIVGLMLILVLVWGMVMRRRLWNEYRAWTILGLGWIVPFSVFVLWYVPQNRQWWLFILPPVCILLALALRCFMSARRRSGLYVGLLAALFIVNFFGSVLTMSDPTNNGDLTLAKQIEAYVEPDDLVITLDRGVYKNVTAYLGYFSSIDAFAMRQIFVPDLGPENDRKLRQKMQDKTGNGHRVYVIGDVLHSELGYRQIARFSSFSEAEVEEKIRAFFADYDLEPVLWDKGEPVLYRIGWRK